MGESLIQIESVEVSYFRSIYSARLKGLSGVSVLGGPNDVGKSNFLKALNLFFNGQTDWKTEFDFERDFCNRRLQQVRRDTVKGKQFVKVSVRFLRGDRYPNSLPEKFHVSRTWDRYGSMKETTSLDNAGAASLGSLRRYLNTVRYEYIPAIRDEQFFTYLLSELQDAVLEHRAADSEVAELVTGLNKAIGGDLQRLTEEFEGATGVSAAVGLPSRADRLFKAFEVATRSSEFDMPLGMRGDGIRSRFLPSLLHYISERSRLYFVWGFEEPENSLEHGLATKLAEELTRNYCSDKSQILMTSHSPAFLTPAERGITLFRVFRDENGTKADGVGSGPDAIEKLAQLDNDLGLLALQERYQREARELLRIQEAKVENLARLVSESEASTAPVLLTEGKWDVAMLEAAWTHRFPDRDRPFRVLSCDTGDSDGGSMGGASVLGQHLKTVRPDMPITVGVFDRDKQGVKEFSKLGNNFAAHPSHDSISCQRQGTCAAILLPAIPGRERFAEVENLELEHYFDESVLSKKVDGYGLRIDPPAPTLTVPGFGQVALPEGQTPSIGDEYGCIDSASKKWFVEYVLPSLTKDDFIAFEGLFTLVESTIEDLKQARAATTSE